MKSLSLLILILIQIILLIKSNIYKNSISSHHENHKDDIEFLQHLENFEATDILTIHIQQKENKKFYIEVNTVPKQIKIYYNVINEGFYVDFSLVEASTNQEIMRKSYINHDFLVFQPERQGLYTLYFNNINNSFIALTVAIHLDENKDDILNKSTVSKMNFDVNEIYQKLFHMQNIKKQINLKYNYHISQASEHNKKILYYSIFEIFVMICVLFVQVRYIVSLTKDL